MSQLGNLAAGINGNSGAPLVSIIIPTRNRVSSLARCLDHVSAIRSNKNWELIVVDNGSTDETPQFLERLGINGAAPRLDEHRLVPVETEPAQVLINAIDEFAAAAGCVEILDAQQEFAVAFPRPRVAEERAVSVSQMQPSGGRRREAADDHPRPP